MLILSKVLENGSKHFDSCINNLKNFKPWNLGNFTPKSFKLHLLLLFDIKRCSHIPIYEY